MIISFPDRTGECTRQPPGEDEKSCNTWSLKPWWGKQILHLFTRQDRNFSTTSSCCLGLGNKCLQLNVNDALQQGCRHHTVDRVKQRSAAVGHIDSVIYCVVSRQFAWTTTAYRDAENWHWKRKHLHWWTWKDLYAVHRHSSFPNSF